jgi:sugar phosphate isomerase/epimerase
MKLGIIQTRLSDGSEGHQTTPSNWIEEFKLLDELSLTHIEWNIDFNKNKNNPLFLLEHQNKIKSVNSKISSVCFDTIVTEKLYTEEDYFENNVCSYAQKIIDLGIENITFPLLEHCSINNEQKLAQIIYKLNDFKERYPKLNINLETDCSIEFLEKILDNVDCFLTYDTGNLTYSNINHSLYIDKFIDIINNVHLKDRIRKTGESVSDFKGDTPFDLIFEKLSSFKYDKIFTLQMARGTKGKEKDLIKKYKKDFEVIYEKYF